MEAKSFKITAFISLSAVLATTIVAFNGHKDEIQQEVFGNPVSHDVIGATASSLTLDNTYVIDASSHGFVSDGLLSLAAAETDSDPSYFRLDAPIRGITQIDIAYGTGSAWADLVPCFYDYQEQRAVNTTSSWPSKQVSYDFSLSPLDYFALYNFNTEYAVTIAALTIYYGCSTATYDFSVSFTPDWNGTSASDPTDIYIAGNPELISDGTQSEGWWYKKMSYANGVYSYDNPSVEVGKYSYSFYAVPSGEPFNWDHQCEEGMNSIEISGNCEDNRIYSWASDPGLYSLTLDLSFLENAATIDGVTVAYDVIDDDEATRSIYEGSWSYEWLASTSLETSYSIAVGDLDPGKSFYFFIKVHDTELNGDIMICPDTDGNYAFRYTPKARGNATVTLDCSLYGQEKSYWEVNCKSASVSNSSYGSLSVAKTTPSSIYHMDVTTSVYGETSISPSFFEGEESFTASYSGENIRIDDNQTIVGIKAGTVTEVTLTALSGASCTFNVCVQASGYSANYDSAYAISNNWFASNEVTEIQGMGAEFYNGVDISSFKALIDNGSHFYNASGVEQHLLYILKDAGVNWVRLRLWVDPKTAGGISYGGGDCNLENVLWMAKEAKAANLKILLDLHYSDFWTHPNQQILPKSWNAECTSKVALLSKITSYTTETLTAFDNAGCLPEMVQLGNEISSGIYLTSYTGEETFIEGKPSYLNSSSSYDYGVDLGLEGRSYDDYADYIKAASDGVRAVGSSIMRVIHWTSGGGSINQFFNAMNDDDYDYAALSLYPFWHFDSMSELDAILGGISISKPWFIAETSYPFSGSAYVDKITSFSIADGTLGLTSIRTDTSLRSGGYPFSVVGQAHMIHDFTEKIVSNKGIGIFYWESAWIPNANVGWAGEDSKNSWGNQGFFSFDGKAMGNLDLFAQMSPSI